MMAKAFVFVYSIAVGLSRRQEEDDAVFMLIDD